jgi:molecular chaperone DnaK (HSP70)
MKQYIVGIDLGTTNTVTAYAKLGSDNIQLFEIDQLVGPGEIAAQPLLPSVRYHPDSWELNDEDIRLPWQAPDIAGLARVVMGRFALDLGAQVPGKLVTSAKSWLSHPSVDRTAPILPWGAATDVGKVSPVDASASYLAYVRSAWNARFPQAPLEQQEVVLTVPASFDEGARTLTVEAARLAKLPNVRLLEEPQAAFYDWLFRHRQTLSEELKNTRLALVCDVGGGTTDLTLIKVRIEDGQPQLTRIGVGDHLMLGGDNMDLALAHIAEARMAVSNARLSASQLSQLIQRCRAGKETLLSANAPDKAAITLLGSGAKLIGGARSVDLMRDEVDRMIVDGFFPMTAPDEQPKRLRSGIVEFGLPYAADAAITRHVAAFLTQHATASREALGDIDSQTLPIPDTLLLNGGVFRAEALAQRLEKVLSTWRGAPLTVLHNDNPDVAVARGAVAYALAREGYAPRIGGGSARSYFLALDEEGQSSRGVCVLPRGADEGLEVKLMDRTFALRLGQPVRFHLISSVYDTGHKAGDLTDLADEGFVRLPPLATVVQSESVSRAESVPVQLTTCLTEAGTLEMHCVSVDDESRRWRLEFQLRSDAEASARLPPRFPEAAEKIDRIFGNRSQQVEAKEVKQLRAELERILGARDTWDTPLLRELFGLLWERARYRRRSANHERVWMNLVGYCLRPGFGYPLDDWRVAQLWPLFEQGFQYVNETQLWSEWWTLWRRVAGGLTEEWQIRVLDDIAFYLQPDGAGIYKRPAGPGKKGYDDMVRLAVSLERIPVERKIEIGNWLLSRLQKPAEHIQSWWAVGRVGAREPFYGSTHNVTPADIAEKWLKRILALDWKKVEPAAFAATQIARMTGDRSRDLAPEIRSEVVQRLTAVNASPTWIAMVSEVVVLERAEEVRVFGESLPAGLRLIR